MHSAHTQLAGLLGFVLASAADVHHTPYFNPTLLLHQAHTPPTGYGCHCCCFIQTELCKNWAASGTCCYGVKCQFAHGEGELRVRASKKKQAALAAAAAAAAVDGRGVEEEGGGLAAAAPCPSYDQVSDAAPMPLDPTAA